MSLPIVIIFIGVLVAAATAAIALGGNNGQALMRKRARAMRQPDAAKAALAGSKRAAASVKRTEARSVPFIDALTKRFMPRQTALRDRLSRTGHDIALGTYAVVCAGLALFVFAAILLAFGKPMLAAPVGLVVGVGLPHMVIGFLGNRRKAQFVAQLPDAIDLITRGLKSGLPVSESMTTVGHEMAAPIGPEFAHVTDCVRFGQQLEDALWDTARRLDTPEFNFFVISLSIQRETGGNLGETLGNLSDIIRRRRHMKLKIKSMSSEAKASAYILGSLPFLMGALIGFINPEYVSVLFTDPRGMALAGAGLTSIAIGVGVMAKMIRFEI